MNSQGGRQKSNTNDREREHTWLQEVRGTGQAGPRLLRPAWLRVDKTATVGLDLLPVDREWH